MQRPDHVIDRRLAIHETVAGGYPAQVCRANRRRKSPAARQTSTAALRQRSETHWAGLRAWSNRRLSHDPQHLRTDLDVVTNGPPSVVDMATSPGSTEPAPRRSVPSQPLLGHTVDVQVFRRAPILQDDVAVDHRDRRFDTGELGNHRVPASGNLDGPRNGPTAPVGTR